MLGIKTFSLAIAASLTSSLAFASTPVYLTGDSWTGVPGWPNAIFYEDFLVANPDISILGNGAEGGRGLALGTYYVDFPSTLDVIGDQMGAFDYGEVDYVIITGGANDFAMRHASVTFEVLRDAAITISEAIVAAGAEPIWANIPLIPWLPSDHSQAQYPWEWTSDLNGMLLGYNAWLKNYCESHGYVYMDLDEAFIAADGSWKSNPDNGNTYGQSDGIHYTEEGAAHLATIVAAAIESANENNPVISLAAGLDYVPTVYAKEGQTLDIEAIRSGNLTGSASGWVGVAPASLAAGPGMWAINWAGDVGGTGIAATTIDGVSVDTEASIWLGWSSGNPTQPGVGIASSVLKIDAVPDVTIDAIAPGWYWAPEITGTIDDPDASIVVTARGVAHAATNNGNGTWTLPQNTLTTPPAGGVGTYTVEVEATDSNGDVDTDATAQVLGL
jgi:lysophospholipase L1-like esterase